LTQSIHRFSLVKLAIFFGFLIVLSGVAIYLFSHSIPQGILSLVLEFGITLSISLFVIRELKKADVSLRSITGDLSMRRKLTVFSATLSAGRLLIYFSFAGLILRLTLLQPTFLAQVEALMNDTSSSPTLSPKSMIGAVLFAPVIEEIIFRGIILNKWAERSSNIRALVLSSLVFGLIHFDSLIVPQLIGGLIYGLVYLKTKKLIYPIFMHILHNLLLFSLLLIPVDEVPETAIVTEQLIDELTTALNISSLVFIISLPIFLFTLYKYSRNLNDEMTPFAFNTGLYSNRT
jgi:membrane protease YdiL (CAAX protease family)